MQIFPSFNGILQFTYFLLDFPGLGDVIPEIGMSAQRLEFFELFSFVG